MDTTQVEKPLPYLPPLVPEGQPLADQIARIRSRVRGAK
jgi:hypothetical protein